MFITERHKRSSFSASTSAFTLIELLVVIAIIAVLAVVVVLTLNPAQLLAQSRDANRVSDMAALNSAIGLYQTDIGGAGMMGSSSVVYTSLADNTSSTCGSLGLPALPSSTIYDCSTATTTRLVNTQGWIPLEFTKISSGAPFGTLPVDPTNQSSSGLYYSYVASGTSYMVTAIPESQKQKQNLGAKPMIPNYPDVIANGSSLTINPLFNNQGLVGYWPMDEGNGSSTQDVSGNGNTGTWAGTPAGTNGIYYAAGKVGQYAGSFDGSTDYIDAGNASALAPLQITVSAWVNLSASMNVQCSVISRGNINNISGYFLILNNGGRVTWQPSGPASYDTTSVTGKVTMGTWTHIVGVASASVSQIYINGVAYTPAARTGPLNYSAGDTHVMIGSSLSYSPTLINGTWQPCLGSIDDVRVYNRAFSAAEIQALYNAER